MREGKDLPLNPRSQDSREAMNGAIGGLQNDCDYDLASLAFRTFAQRSLCASAILRRASLLRTRFVPNLFPPA